MDKEQLVQLKDHPETVGIISGEDLSPAQIIDLEIDENWREDPWTAVDEVAGQQPYQPIKSKIWQDDSGRYHAVRKKVPNQKSPLADSKRKAKKKAAKKARKKNK